MKHLNYTKLQPREVFKFKALSGIRINHPLDEWNLSQIAIESPYGDMKPFSVFVVVF